MKTVLAIAAGGAGCGRPLLCQHWDRCLTWDGFSMGNACRQSYWLFRDGRSHGTDGDHVVAECRAARLPNRWYFRCLDNVLCIYARRRLVAWARGNVIGRGLYFRFCSSVAGWRVRGNVAYTDGASVSGVQHRKVEMSDADQRLDRWFLKHFPELPRGRLQKLLRTGQVRVDGKRAKAGLRLNVGQEIRIPPITVTTTVSKERRRRYFGRRYGIRTVLGSSHGSRHHCDR